MASESNKNRPVLFFLYFIIFIIVSLTAFVIYYNLNMEKIIIIDAENTFTDQELAKIQQDIQSIFWLEVQTARHKIKSYDNYYNPWTGTIDGLRLIESELFPKPENKDFYIYLIDQEFTKSIWVHHIGKRTQLISVKELRNDAANQSTVYMRLYKLIMRFIGWAYGAGIRDECKDMAFKREIREYDQSMPKYCWKGCGISKRTGSMYEIDNLPPYFCEDDAEDLKAMKIIR